MATDNFNLADVKSTFKQLVACPMPNRARILEFPTTVVKPVKNPRRYSSRQKNVVAIQLAINRRTDRAMSEKYSALRREIEAQEEAVHIAENVLVGFRIQVIRLREQLNAALK